MEVRLQLPIDAAVHPVDLINVRSDAAGAPAAR